MVAMSDGSYYIKDPTHDAFSCTHVPAMIAIQQDRFDDSKRFAKSNQHFLPFT